MKKVVVIFIAFIFSLQVSVADSVTVKGQGTVDYESGVFSSEPDKKDIKKARKKAVKKAWKKYVSRFDSAKRKAYRSMKDDFLSELDEYLINDPKVVEIEIDEDSATVTVYIRAEFDDGKVQAQLSESMPSTGGNNELFAFLFVTRQQGSIKQKDDKVTSMSSAETIHSASEKVKASGGSVASLDKEKAVAKTVTGGNTVRSSEQVKWIIQGSNEVDVAVKQTLLDAKYTPVEYGDIVELEDCGGGPTPEKIRNEFAKKVNMSSKTAATMKKITKRCDVPFLGVGTLDIMLASTDPVTGLTLVTVSVTAKIYDTKGRIPVGIGSVGPVQFKGLGDGEQVARNNAVIKASKNLAEQLVNQLGMR